VLHLLVLYGVGSDGLVKKSYRCAVIARESLGFKFVE
jgi:hypothetical protein